MTLGTAKMQDIGPKAPIGSLQKPAKAPKEQKRYKLKTMGKVAFKWALFRRQWLFNNPPDDCGEYVCGICRRKVHESEVTLDHKIPRSRAPELRYDPANIQPAHQLCNYLKGSRTQLVDGRLKND